MLTMYRCGLNRALAGYCSLLSVVWSPARSHRIVVLKDESERLKLQLDTVTPHQAAIMKGKLALLAAAEVRNAHLLTLTKMALETVIRPYFAPAHAPPAGAEQPDVDAALAADEAGDANPCADEETDAMYTGQVVHQYEYI
jgi:hypothetical protein